MGTRVLKATILITLAHGLARVFGLIQSRIIGDFYGMGTEYDAFVIAFEGVIWTLFLIGEESLGPAFLPVFMDAKEKDGEERAWRFTSTLMNLQLGILLFVTAILFFFPQQAVELLTRGEGNTARNDLAIRFLGTMAPTLIGISLSSLTYMVLNGYKEFFYPALADAALKIGLVAGVSIGFAVGLDKDALILGALAAGCAKLFVHIFAIGPRLKFYRPSIDLNDPYVRRFLLLVAPLLFGIVFAKVRDYFNNIYILSQLESGILSLNSAGRKIFNTVSGLIPYPLSIAMFPFFCELVARDDKKALGDFLTRSSRMLILFFLPMSVVIFVLSDPLGRLVFETGQVGGATAASVGLINSFYCMVLPFQALEFIFMQAYFSTQRMVSVTIIGIVFSALTMVISYVGVVHYGMKGVDAIIVVALSYTISRALKTITLVTMIKMRGLPVLPFAPTLLFAFRVIILALACGGASYATLKAVNRVIPAEQEVAVETSKPEAPKPEAPKADTADAPKDTKGAKPAEPPKKKSTSGLRAALRAAPRLAIPALAAVVVFLIGCKLLRLIELDEMIAFAKEKMKRRKKKPA